MGVVSRALGVDDTRFLRSVDVQLILLVSMVSSMGSIASPALPAMSSSLGIDPARIGLVFTAFTLPAIFVLPAVGAVGDIFSRRAVVVPGLFLFGVAGFGVGLVDDFWAILVLRGLQGVGYTAFNSLTVAMLGDHLTGQTESAAQGFRVTLNKTTGFVGPAVAGGLAALAWYYPFYLYGLAVPVGVLVYLYLDSPAPEAVGSKEGGTEVRRSIGSYLVEMADLIRRPFIAAILVGGFFRLAMKYALYAFLALAVVEQYGGSLGYAGFLVGLYNLIGAVVASQSARFTGVTTHSYALIAGFLVAAISFVAFPLVGGIVGLTLLVTVHGVGEGIINPVHKSIMSQSVAAGVRAGLVTTNAIVQNVAKTITPVALGGLLAVVGRESYDQLFFAMGAVTLVVTLLALSALVAGRPTSRPA